MSMTSIPLLAAGLALCLVLASCGDDAKPKKEEGAAESGWSRPAAGDGVGVGSPDGDAGPRSAEALLGDLVALVRGGGGLVDPAYEHSVQAVAAVLFDPRATGPEAQAAQVHMQVSSVAADTGRWIAKAEGGRGAVEAEHPWDVRVYDAFLEAAAGGPDAYKAWCGGAGATLWRQFTEARRKALSGK